MAGMSQHRNSTVKTVIGSPYALPCWYRVAPRKLTASIRFSATQRHAGLSRRIGGDAGLFKQRRGRRAVANEFEIDKNRAI
jgi:hypothetical protein